MSRPLSGDYGAFYSHYVSLALGNNPLELINLHASTLSSFIDALPEEKGDYSYAPGKWTVKQMLQHLLDSERIFIYRLIWIARGDERPLPGFDENRFADAAPATHRTLSDLKQEFLLLRASSDLLMASLTADQLSKRGEASGYPVTVNALCFIIFGHNLHHINVLSERYA